MNGYVEGFGPLDWHNAYSLPWKSNYQQTIGIVLWGDIPTLKKDLDTFNSTFGLGFFPTCTTSGWASCFQKVNQNGTASPLPAVDGHAGIEWSLDVQTAHAICLNCKILVVEAFSNSTANLAAAENTAYRLGATEISNSYGAPELNDNGTVNSTCQSWVNSYAGAWNHPGVAITVSSGDAAYSDGPQCPADLNTVVAVGGTDLNLNDNGFYAYETTSYQAGYFYDENYNLAYYEGGGGSSCSRLVSARSWQTALSNWSQTGCGSKRGIADVSADYFNAWIYDSTPDRSLEPATPESGNWYLLNGTSLSAPLLAGVYALGAHAWTVQYAAQLAYQHRTSLHDVAQGINGDCSTIMCKAVAGYDGPTGLGSPNGLGAF